MGSAASGETIEVINPATREVLARVPRGTAADVDAAVEAAAAAFPAWRDTNATAAGALVARWARADPRARGRDRPLESQEVGRPHWGPLPIGGMLEFIAGQADKVLGERCRPTPRTCSG